MKIYNKYMLFSLISILNQYNMNDDSNNKIGLFTLSSGIKKNEYTGECIVYCTPGFLVQKGEKKWNMSAQEDQEHWLACKRAHLLSNDGETEGEKKIVSYPILASKSGGSAGLMYYIAQLRYNNLPVYNNKHSYGIKYGIFGTGGLGKSDFEKVDEIQDLYFKLVSLDTFLSDKKDLIANSVLLLPQDNKIEYLYIKNCSKLQNMPQNIIFSNSLSDFKDSIKNLSFSKNEITINYTEQENSRFVALNLNNNKIDDLVKIMTSICTDIKNIKEYTGNEIIKLVELFLIYYEYLYSSEKQPDVTTIKKVYEELFLFLSLKYSNTIFFKQWLDILKLCFLDDRISNEHKIGLIRSLNKFIKQSVANVDYCEFSLLYQMIDDLLLAFASIKNYATVSLGLTDLLEELHDKVNKVYVDDLKEYKNKIKELSNDSKKSLDQFQTIINTYPLLFKVDSIENERKKESFDLCLNKDKDNDFHIDLKGIVEELKKFLKAINSEYSKSELIAMLNTDYGINTGENVISAKSFFEQFEKTDILKKEGIFLMFAYFYFTLEKNIFELDNPEFKAAFKDFILKWIHENSSFEPLALLLTYYAFMSYIELTKELENIEKKMEVEVFNPLNGSREEIEKINNDIIYKIIEIKAKINQKDYSLYDIRSEYVNSWHKDSGLLRFSKNIFEQENMLLARKNKTIEEKNKLPNDKDIHNIKKDISIIEAYINTINTSSNNRVKILEKQEFFLNLFVDVCIANVFNEALLKYLINVVYKDNSLKNFFVVLAQRAFQIDNNYIQTMIFDKLISDIDKDCLDKRLFEAIPSLFFSFHDKKQVDYIKKIFKSGKIEKYKKYALYTLIDFINSKFQNNNLMGSLHSMDVLSNDWILVNEKLTCSQNCLYELLICLDKIIIDNDDYQELKWLRKREYTKDFCFHKNILSGLLNCPQFLKTLFIYFVKNNIQFQTLDLNFINKKLQNMKKHYEDQIAMAKTYKNKYTKYYQMCLDDINQIENLKNNEYVQKPKEIGKQEVILSANNTKNVSENNIQKSLNAQQLPDKEPMREKDFSECQLDADELNSLFKSLCYSGNKEIKQPDWKQNESFKWLLDYYMKNNNEYKKFILSNDLSETTNTIPHLKDLLSRFKIITSHFIDFLSEAAKKPKPS